MPLDKIYMNLPPECQLQKLLGLQRFATHVPRPFVRGGSGKSARLPRARLRGLPYIMSSTFWDFCPISLLSSFKTHSYYKIHATSFPHQLFHELL